MRKRKSYQTPFVVMQEIGAQQKGSSEEVMYLASLSLGNE